MPDRREFLSAVAGVAAAAVVCPSVPAIFASRLGEEAVIDFSAVERLIAKTAQDFAEAWGVAWYVVPDENHYVRRMGFETYDGLVFEARADIREHRLCKEALECRIIEAACELPMPTESLDKSA